MPQSIAAREQLQQMREPEPLRSLRRQKERIEQEFMDALSRQNYDQEAERLRDQIRRMGHKPYA